MAVGTFSVPPWQTPEPGYVFYRPDPFYFVEEGLSVFGGKLKDFPIALAARVTARTAARWANRYWATPTFHRKPSREGTLPRTAAKRESFIDELFVWFGQEAGEHGFSAEMSLRHGDRWVMDAHDGFPGPLRVKPTQFALLQERLLAAGLPRDLYYPWNQERRVVEPVEMFGGIMRGVRSYSPLQWAHRDPAKIAAIRVPSEEERRERFANESYQFQQALHRRLHELREPGKDWQSDEVRELEELVVSVSVARSAPSTPNGALRRLRSRPTAGWSEPPTTFQALQTALPTLRRLHRNGWIWQIFSQGRRSDGTIERWVVNMWVPDVGQDVSYPIVDGVVFGPPHMSPVDTSGMPMIMRLADGQASSLLDSSDVWELALGAGGRDFAERVGARPGEMRLRGNSEGRLVWSVSWGRFFPHATFRVIMDARMGDILERRQELPPPSDLVEPEGG